MGLISEYVPEITLLLNPESGLGVMYCTLGLLSVGGEAKKICSSWSPCIILGIYGLCLSVLHL